MHLPPTHRHPTYSNQFKAESWYFIPVLTAQLQHGSFSSLTLWNSLSLSSPNFLTNKQHPKTIYYFIYSSSPEILLCCKKTKSLSPMRLGTLAIEVQDLLVSLRTTFRGTIQLKQDTAIQLLQGGLQGLGLCHAWVCTFLPALSW